MANEENLKPFEKGDKRINRRGRQIVKPDQFKALVLKLANEQAVKLKPTKEDGALEATPVTIDGVPVANIEMILRKWMNSDQRAIQFVEYAYGKVPQPVAVTGADGGPLLWKQFIQSDDTNTSTDSK